MNRAKRKWLRRYMALMERDLPGRWTHEANVRQYKKMWYRRNILWGCYGSVPFCA